MDSIIPLEIKDINSVLSQCARSQYKYHEYPFFTDNILKDHTYTTIDSILQNNDSLSYIAVRSGKIHGLIVCIKNDFDSEIFGFSCYRITHLLIFSEKNEKVIGIITQLISVIEKKLAGISLPFHLTFSLNNNSIDANQIFNALSRNNFFYIQTLLTFSSIRNTLRSFEQANSNNILIRIANENDALQVASLARKSFKFSRFHLDPFLNKKKADLLLQTSAMNSILNGYVDIMFVAEINNRIVGYYSGTKKYNSDLKMTIGNAGVSAVDSESRGLGVFSKLDCHLLNWFAENTDFAEMGTYLANYPIHKTWINRGLSLIRGEHQFSKFIER